LQLVSIAFNTIKGMASMHLQVSFPGSLDALLHELLRRIALLSRVIVFLLLKDRE
jgi:hypothetical protein